MTQQRMIDLLHEFEESGYTDYTEFEEAKEVKDNEKARLRREIAFIGLCLTTVLISCISLVISLAS